MTEQNSVVGQLEEQAPEQHRLTIQDYIPGGSATLETAAGFEGFQSLESNYHDYNGQLERIRNNPDLSDDERISLAAQARQEATAAHEQAVEALAGAVAQESRKLETRLFAGPNSSTSMFPEQRAADVASQESYRNALASLSGQDAETLQDTLDRANLTGDELLAQAVLTTAHRGGHLEQVSSYMNGRPEQAGRYSTLTTLPGENALSVLASGYRPPEVQRVEELQTPEPVRQRIEHERRSREQAALREANLGSRPRGRYDRTPPR